MTARSTNGQQGFLPNFCDVTVLFMLILLVELLALVLSLAPGDNSDFWLRLAFISMFTQWLALINAGLLCIWRKHLNRLSLPVNAAVSFAMMMSVSLIFSILVIYFGHHFGFYTFIDSDWIQYFLIRNLSISALVYAVVLRYFYIQYQWKINLESQSHAQIQALKARIRPHFLFNSMNTIASLISIDASKAEKAVEDLSDLFRASLQDKTSHSLADEIALTHSYVDIEQLRLGDRLRTEWSNHPVPMDLVIPALCLQPLVENAIYHGIEPLPNGGTIKINAQIHDNRLCLSVSNPISAHSNMRNHNSNHMAQDNIRQRIKLLYGETGGFEISETDSLYTVNLWIPID